MKFCWFGKKSVKYLKYLMQQFAKVVSIILSTDPKIFTYFYEFEVGKTLQPLYVHVNIKFF